MICLHCGKPITDASEAETHWHKRCIREFFGTAMLPELTIDDEMMRNLVTTSVSEGYTVPGVQKKISLHLSNDRPARLTLIGYPVGYIMKPQTEEYRNLPEYEFLGMLMAERAGIKVVPFALYCAGAEYVYLTRRVDRAENARLAMEDFCQLNERLSEDKYKGSYEGCAKIIRKYSKARNLDLAELFSRIVFSYLIGNSDMHLKNFSLIESEPGKRDFRLSPAYDILSVNAVEPEDLDELALALNGKTRKLTLRDFLEFAEYCEISENTALRLIGRLLAQMPEFLEMIHESFLSTEQKESLRELMLERAKVLEG